MERNDSLVFDAATLAAYEKGLRAGLETARDFLESSLAAYCGPSQNDVAVFAAHVKRRLLRAVPADA